MNVGDRVRVIPSTFGMGVDKPGETASHTRSDYNHKPKPLPGTVTYIHPSGRWYQVTFDNGVKECFFVDVEPTPKEREPVNRSRLYGSVINDY